MGERELGGRFPWGGESWTLLPPDTHGHGQARKMAAGTSRVDGRRAGV